MQALRSQCSSLLLLGVAISWGCPATAAVGTDHGNEIQGCRVVPAAELVWDLERSAARDHK